MQTYDLLNLLKFKNKIKINSTYIEQKSASEVVGIKGDIKIINKNKRS